MPNAPEPRAPRVGKTRRRALLAPTLFAALLLTACSREPAPEAGAEAGGEVRAQEPQTAAAPEVAGSDPPTDGATVEAPEGDPGVTVVEVRDVEGRPVDGARVEVAEWPVGSAALHGASAGGRASIHLVEGQLADGAEAPVWLLVRHGSSARAVRRALFPPFPAQLELTLRPTRSARGEVRWVTGPRAAETTHVIAWPADDRFARERLARWRKGERDALLHIARVEQSGRFELRDLDPFTAYHVTATRGDELAAELVELPAGERAADGLVLEVTPLHALLVSLRDGGGGPVDTRLRDGAERPAVQRDPALRWLEVAARPDLALTALQPYLERGTGQVPFGEAPRVLVAAAGRDETRIGPALFEARVPGYAPVQRNVDLPPLTDPPQKTTLYTREVDGVWGSVEVHVGLGAEARGELEGEERSLGWLALTTDDGSLWLAQLPPLAHFPHRVERVPQGEYRAFLVPRDGPFRRRGTETERSLTALNVAEKPVRLDLDLRAEALVALTVRADGARYAGPLVLSFESEEEAFEVALDAASHHRVLGLPAGEYGVRALSPAGLEVAAGEPLVVEPGAFLRVPLEATWR